MLLENAYNTKYLSDALLQAVEVSIPENVFTFQLQNGFFIANPTTGGDKAIAGLTVEGQGPQFTQTSGTVSNAADWYCAGVSVYSIVRSFL